MDSQPLNLPRTLYDKLWDSHCVLQRDDGSTLLYIDRHYIHEVTSPQAFSGLRAAGRSPWSTAATVATVDHAIPTNLEERGGGIEGIKDKVSGVQVRTLRDNCADFDIVHYGLNDPRQGIVHVIGPELGMTLPGMSVVCGDSHTATHGALGALAFGIGTSEVEHVLATQCLVQRKSKNMRLVLEGTLAPLISSKDLILATIGRIGVSGGVGNAIEFAGSAVECLSMEGRMTLCNMAIESGARIGLVAVDDVTIDYLQPRIQAAMGDDFWRRAQTAWRELHSDAKAHFDVSCAIDISELKPQVTWGTTPEMVADLDSQVPSPSTDGQRDALEYMGLRAGQAFADIELDYVFIGSCTNGRIEDLRVAAEVVDKAQSKGGKISSNLKQALVVPGSQSVKRQAEAEGLHEVFISAGMSWREPGCSMCLAMNSDRLLPKERCASTSNRNFEGRQGHGGRTHLLSPASAAAAAIAGRLVDPRHIV